MTTKATEHINTQLQSIERNTTAIIANDYSICNVLLSQISQIPASDLCIQLIHWSYNYPNATNLLLIAVAKSNQPIICNHVADALILTLPSWDEDRDCSIGAGLVLSSVFDRFHGYMRDFVADREEVYIPHNLKPGIDYHPLGKLTDSEEWNDKEIPPEPQSNYSIKCLLRQQGIPCGSLDDTWDEKARRGLAYFQLLNNIEPTGELDKRTMDKLQETHMTLLSEK